MQVATHLLSTQRPKEWGPLRVAVGQATVSRQAPSCWLVLAFRSRARIPYASTSLYAQLSKLFHARTQAPYRASRTALSCVRTVSIMSAWPGGKGTDHVILLAGIR